MMNNNNNCKWYNVEIPYYSRETIERANNFKAWLHDNCIKFETSGLSSGSLQFVHFEVYASENDLKRINNALDDLVWFDAIHAI